MEAPPPNAFAALRAFLLEDGWNIEEADEGISLHSKFSGEHGSWPVFAFAVDGDCPVVVYSHLPMQVDARLRPAMMEFITRANNGLNVGNFEMDLDTGDVRFKTSADRSEGAPDDDQLHAAFYANMAVMDTYYLGLMAVLAGKAASAAIALAEA